MSTILIIVLILLLIGAFPAYSTWGNAGGIGIGTVILIVVLILLFGGRLH